MKSSKTKDQPGEAVSRAVLEPLCLVVPQVVRARRLARGLTLLEVCRRSKLSLSMVTRIERGARVPGLGTLVRLGRALGCPPWELLREADRRLPRA